MSKIILVASVFVIVVLALEAYRENLGNEWRRYQGQYQVALRQLAASGQEREVAENYEIKMRQIVLPELGRVDRCTSCHVGLEDPRMADREQPLAAHPGDSLEVHDIDTIGCTVCHDGQGRAITAREAHAVGVPYWDKPMLYGPYLESTCFRCHQMKELLDLTSFQRGRRLFFSNGCLGCHKLDGKGGQLAPDLTNLADANVHLKHPANSSLVRRFHDNANLAYIYEAIKEPSAQPDITAMPDFGFSEEDIGALMVYLKSLSQRAVPAAYLAQKRREHQREDVQGEALFQKYCVACHGVNARGGVRNINYVKRTVPALDVLAERMFLDEPEDAHRVARLLSDGVDLTTMSPKLDVPRRGRVLAQYRAIRNVIEKGSAAGKADPAGPEPLLHMPSWAEGLTRQDIDSILGYLLTLYDWKVEEAQTNEEGGQ